MHRKIRNHSSGEAPDQAARRGPVHLPEPRQLVPILGAWAAAFAVLIYQRDLGSSLLFFTLFVVMIWVATERVGYLILGALLLWLGRSLLDVLSDPLCESLTDSL